MSDNSLGSAVGRGAACAEELPAPNYQISRKMSDPYVPRTHVPLHSSPVFNIRCPPLSRSTVAGDHPESPGLIAPTTEEGITRWHSQHVPSDTAATRAIDADMDMAMKLSLELAAAAPTEQPNANPADATTADPSVELAMRLSMQDSVVVPSADTSVVAATERALVGF